MKISFWLIWLAILILLVTVGVSTKSYLLGEITFDFIVITGLAFIIRYLVQKARHEKQKIQGA